jgi:hypothetical protein
LVRDAITCHQFDHWPNAPTWLFDFQSLSLIVIVVCAALGVASSLVVVIFGVLEANMAPASAEEAALMAELLADISNDPKIPSPTVKPKAPPPRFSPKAAFTPRRTPGRCPKRSAQKASHVAINEDADMAMLLDGAEDWSWDDMLTPVKRASPKKVRCAQQNVELL